MDQNASGVERLLVYLLHNEIVFKSIGKNSKVVKFGIHIGLDMRLNRQKGTIQSDLKIL